MITLTYKQLNDFNIANALRKLADTRGFSIKVAYRIAKLNEKIQKEMDNARKFYGEKIIKEFFVTDEKGNIQMDPSSEEAGKPLIKDGRDAEFKTAYKDFLALEVQIDRWKIQAEDIQAANLSGMELIALEPLLDGLEELLNEAPTTPETAAS
jgi:hypothetical protein